MMDNTVFFLEEGDVRYEVREAGLLRRLRNLTPSGYVERLEVGDIVIERPESGVTLSFSMNALQNVRNFVEKAIEEEESLKEYEEELEGFKEKYGHEVPGGIVSKYAEAKNKEGIDMEEDWVEDIDKNPEVYLSTFLGEIGEDIGELEKRLSEPEN